MPSLTDVFVAILPDTSKFGPEVTRALRRIDAANDGKRVGGTFSSGFSGATKGIAAGLVGAFAAVGAVSLFKGFIQDAAEAAKITRITENTIASMGNVANVSSSQITGLAGSIAAKTGIDDAAIQAGQNLMLTFSNVRNEVGKGNDIFTQATRLGVDMSVALGTDASGAALQLGKALNDPVKGISALSRAGVSFTTQQKEQIKTLVASGDTLGAQKIILGELEKQFGGTAAAAADPMARLSYVVGEIGESIGALLLPAVTAFASFAGEKLIPAVQGLIDGFGSGQGAAGRFADIFGRVKDGAQGLFDLLVNGDFTGQFARAFGVAEDAPIVGFLLGLRDTAVDTFDEIKGGITAFVAAFKDGGDDITSSGFAGALEQLGVFARDAFDYVKSDVIPAAISLGRTLRDVGEGALPLIVGAFKTMFDTVTGVFNFIKSNDTVFSSLAAGLVAGYVALQIFTAATKAFAIAQGITMAVTTAYRAVLQAYSFWTYTATGSTTAFAFAMNVLKVAFLTNPIGIVVIGLVALGAALFVAYKKSETFRDIVNGAWAAIKDGAGAVVDWFTGTALPWMQGVFQGIGDRAGELWVRAQAVWSGIQSGFDTAMTGVRAVYDNVIVPVFNAYKAAAQFLWDGVQVVWSGIAAGFDLYMRGVKGVYDNVIVPLFGAFKAAAQFLYEGVQFYWGLVGSGFNLAMRGLRTVYDNVIVPLWSTFRSGVEGLLTVFDTVVGAIGRTWDTLKDKLKTPIRVAFDFVNDYVIDPMNLILDKFPGSLDIPNLPALKDGGPVKGPGGPRDDKVLLWGSAGEFMVNARQAKKHRRLLDDVNSGRLPGDETGGPVGDVFETLKGAASSVSGFASDMLAKGARKAAELLLGPLRDRLFALIGSPDNVAAAVLRGGLEKVFAAILAKGDEQDKVQSAAAKSGGTGSFPGGGSTANLVAFGRLMQSMGARVSEHPQFGGVNPVHTTGSNHYIGRAIDVNYGPGGENAIEKQFFDAIVARGLPKQYGLRTIWRAPGHFNHMHNDYDRGGYLMPGATGQNRGSKPERVLTPAQTDSFDRLVKLLEKGQGAASTPPLVVHAYGAREETLAQHVLEGLRRRDALYQMG